MEKNLNFPILILLASIIRPILLGASIGDALVIIGLSSLYAYRFYLESKKEPIANKNIIDRIVDLEEQVKVNKEVIHSVKLGNSLRK